MHDARQPLLDAWRYWVSWADAHRPPSWLAALLLGLMLTLPWLLPAVQDVWAAQDSLAQLSQQQHDLTALEVRNIALTRLVDTESTLPALPDSVAQLTTSAHGQGLQTSDLTVGKPTQLVTAERMNLQQLPVSLRVQGAWADWQQWIARWPEALPGVTLAELELQAQASGEVVAKVSVWLPQRQASKAAQQASAEPEAHKSPSSATAVDAAAWAQVQQQSRQHASFSPWRASELNRPRQPLESVAREQVQYTGHLEQAGRKLALLRVTQPAQSALAEFHAVGVGAYVGHDMGRIEAIDPHQLRLRELVRNANGVWHARAVFIPFKEAWP
jgi:Tfp pilus assembly protein PilP